MGKLMEWLRSCWADAWIKSEEIARKSKRGYGMLAPKRRGREKA